LVFVLFAGVAFAQKDSLAFDENNKYIYYQVVQQPGLSTDSLLNRVKYFSYKASPSAEIYSIGMIVIGKEGSTDSIYRMRFLGHFLVSKKSLATSHEDGVIKFSMSVEVKGGKYRYWLTDFVFNPYQRDRYNNYVSVPGVYIPLEKSEGKIDKKDLTAYLDGVLLNSRKIGTKLKELMLKTPPVKKVPAVKKISTKDW